MEFGVSPDTIKLIEERLGPSWAKVSLCGVTAGMIITPAVLGLGTIAVIGGALVGTWSWAVGELNADANRLALSLLGPALAIFVTWLLCHQARKVLREIRILIEEAKALRH